MPELLDLFALLAEPEPAPAYAADVVRTKCGACLPGTPNRHAGCARDRYATTSDEHGRAWLCSCPCWNPPPPQGD